jgi:Leucine-rich repeat (LRR) protein
MFTKNCFLSCVVLFSLLCNVCLIHLNRTNLNEYLMSQDEFVSKINLTNKNIDSIERGVFENFTSIKTLYLSENLLTELGDGDLFNGLENLVNLSLSSNRIEFLNPKIFTSISKLENLWLRKNRLNSSMLNSTTFHGLFNLVELALSNNSLTILDDELFVDLVSLKILSLSYNCLSEIRQNAFGSLTKLTNLYLTTNKLTYLHPEIFRDLKNLEFLRLNDNQLDFVHPDLFKSLFKLKELYLQTNRIKSLDSPFIFSDLISLNDLSLSYNFLGDIGSNYSLVFSHLKNVQKIWLKRNRISHVEHKVFMCMENLRYLNLCGNSLQLKACANLTYMKNEWANSTDYACENLSSEEVFGLNS